VSAWADAGVPAAEGGGGYELDMWTIAIYAHAASAYIPGLRRTRPDLAGPMLWHGATTLATEAGLSVDPLD
jgi:hypothetical protein